ncbi:MAG: S-methyl-5'-thioadenosine phosphorylase [Thermomicrobiales bacterium]|nr:S-methyl-5'-thioadenosine phosphorylase [Thermomicrobiales bacterium]
MSTSPRLGIIGGSGLYQLSAFSQAESHEIETPYGAPSSPISVGTVGTTPVAFVSRHGIGHHHSPTDVPYRANIYALKSLGVTHLVSISAVGSLSEAMAPGTFVVPDQIIDRTVNRDRTFFDGGVVAHVSMADPFCAALSSHVAACAETTSVSTRLGGTYVCIEGPQFSTRAESKMFRSWGGSVIGMTAMPEARLAREAGLCYACLAMVTDWDVWHETEEAVSVAAVVETLNAMTSAVQTLVIALAEAQLPSCTSACTSSLEHAIVTDPARIPEQTAERLLPIAGRRIDDR